MNAWFPAGQDHEGLDSGLSPSVAPACLSRWDWRPGEPHGVREAEGSLRSRPFSQQGERQAVGLQDSPRIIKVLQGSICKRQMGKPRC